jgi:hypothetical protein
MTTADMIAADLIAADLAAAYEAAGELDAAWALANPERALAILMVDPRPCAALDALIFGASVAEAPVALAA